MEASQHTFVAETGQPAQRRKKARLACNPCRARKTGCDGRKPVCSACSMRGWSDKCFYPDSVMQPSTALTLVDIDRRLQKLENEARAGHEISRNSPSSTKQPSFLDVVAHDAGAARSPTELSLKSSSVSFDHAAMNDQSLQEPVDACANEPSATANAAFMRRGLEAAGHRQHHDTAVNSQSPVSPIESPTFPDLVGFSLHTPDRPFENLDPHTLYLPQRHFADDLLRWYWQNFHSIFPFLNWPVFKNRYRAIWKQKPPARPAFDDILYYATLNMVLALACLRHESIPLEQRPYHADDFYRRSLQLVSAETLDSTSISIVQLLLLRAMYLYFAGKADRCWLMAGAAVRVAIGLGLHIDSKRHLNQMEREMRRRIWYGGCVSLDQIVSATFGRPGLIFPGLTQTAPPLAIDEEYLSTTGEGHQPEGLPSRLDMMTFTLKTVEILEEMKSARRAPGIKLKHAGDEITMPDPTNLLSVNAKIDDLLEGLPEHLRPDADYSKMLLNEDAVKCFRIQSHAIRFRLLTIRVFLLRPSLLAEAQRWTNPAACSTLTASSMLQERLHHEICSLCLGTVHTMLEEIQSGPATNGGISAWYALHFTFAAATILLVATLSPNLGVCLDTEPTKSSWDRVMAILDFHKSHVASAARGIEVLQRYRESITRRANARLGRPQLGHEFGACATGISSPTAQQGVPVATPPSLVTSSYTTQAQQAPALQPQQFTHPQQSWNEPHAMPTPPMAGTGLMEGLDPHYIGSETLDEAWLTMQDYGQGNWMLEQFRLP
ncbi:hypothetical protein VTI28DRAFT_8097 [Corynascus sepedonium]